MTRQTKNEMFMNQYVPGQNLLATSEQSTGRIRAVDCSLTTLERPLDFNRCELNSEEPGMREGEVHWDPLR